MTDPDLYTNKPSKLVFYSATWCPDCKKSKAFLDQHQVDYLNVDIGKDSDSFIFVEKLTRRVRIPTLVFPDGTVLVEPGDDVLGIKLGIK